MVVQVSLQKIHNENFLNEVITTNFWQISIMYFVKISVMEMKGKD